jgi:hypothetical protein
MSPSSAPATTGRKKGKAKEMTASGHFQLKAIFSATYPNGQCPSPRTALCIWRIGAMDVGEMDGWIGGVLE